jgi:NADH-quinone oxidoreductase subunit E
MKYQKIYEALQERLEIKFGETTVDKRFTLLPNACLGCCDHAPALMIDEDLFTDIRIEKLDQILNKYV